MYCQHCGTQLPTNPKFCHNCGKENTGFSEKPVSAAVSMAALNPIPATAPAPPSQTAQRTSPSLVTVLKWTGAIVVVGGLLVAGIAFYSAKQQQAEEQATCNDLLSKPAPPWPDCEAKQAEAQASARPGEFATIYECRFYNTYSERAQYENCKSRGRPW